MKKSIRFLNKSVLLTIILIFFCGVAFGESTITASLSSTTISENLEAGTIVGALDIGCEGTPAVSFISGSDYFDLSVDDGLYQLVTKESFDYEERQSYLLVLSITDDNETVEKSFTVFVENEDEVAPVAEASFEETDEDTPLIGRLVATDAVDSVQPLTYISIDTVSSGAIELNENGTYVYTPSLNFSGTDSFTFKAYDGVFYSNTETVTITINPVNDAPLNTSLPSLEGVFERDHSITASTGSWEDADSQADALTYSYQWQYTPDLEGSALDIGGENALTYTVEPDKRNQYIRIKVACSD